MNLRTKIKSKSKIKIPGLAHPSSNAPWSSSECHSLRATGPFPDNLSNCDVDHSTEAQLLDTGSRFPELPPAKFLPKRTETSKLMCQWTSALKQHMQKKVNQLSWVAHWSAPLGSWTENRCPCGWCESIDTAPPWGAAHGPALPTTQRNTTGSPCSHATQWCSHTSGILSARCGMHSSCPLSFACQSATMTLVVHHSAKGQWWCQQNLRRKTTWKRTLWKFPTKRRCGFFDKIDCIHWACLLTSTWLNTPSLV